MLNAIEDIFMANPIKDTANLKSMDSDNRLKSKQPDSKDAHMETNTFLDSVCFSSTSKQLEALKASLSNVPEINEARVAYFKAEIASGSYEINNDNIARSMFNLEMA